MATAKRSLIFVIAINLLLGLACGSGPGTNQVNESATEEIEAVTTGLSVPTGTPTPIIAFTDMPLLTPSSIPTEEISPAEVNEDIVKQVLPTPFALAENSVNLRDGPGTNYGVVGSLSPGDSFAIIGRNADASWWQISVDDRLVWVSADVVTPSNTDQDIPIVEAGPPPPTIAPASTEAPILELTPIPLPELTLPPAPACDCSGDIYNCDDFKSREEAHACFDYCQSIGAGDIHNLDGDADGQFCESR